MLPPGLASSGVPLEAARPAAGFWREAAATCCGIGCDSWRQRGFGAAGGLLPKEGGLPAPSHRRLESSISIIPEGWATMHCRQRQRPQEHPARPAPVQAGNGRRASTGTIRCGDDWASIRAACCRHRACGPRLALPCSAMVKLSLARAARVAEMDTFRLHLPISRGWGSRLIV